MDGIPKFCKIDVEGYELELIQELSSKIEFISFKAYIEFIKEIEEIFELLKERFGSFKVNFKLGENTKFYNKSLKNPDLLLDIIKSISNTSSYFDMIVKFKTRS